jgi:hypothetical protein
LSSSAYDLWQVPLGDPGHARQLTFGQADEDRPSTSSDGRWLLYTDNHEGCTALVRHALRTGDEHTLSVTGLDYRRPTGTLALGVVDKATGAATVARVSVLDVGGKFYAPPGALYRIDRGTGHFYCHDTAEVRLPAGEYRLRVRRGPEYRVAQQTVRVEPGRTVQATVELERWVDAAIGHRTRISDAERDILHQLLNTPAVRARFPSLTREELCAIADSLVGQALATPRRKWRRQKTW